MSEMYTENNDFDREWCLRRLIVQAQDRQIDPIADKYLIEQLNASHTESSNIGDTTECQVGGCALRCLTTNDGGILKLRLTTGTLKCDVD